MRKLFLIILLFSFGQAFATDYYFANAGNDVSGAGTSLSPWATTGKAQTYATTGNRLYFKRGDIFVLTSTLTMQGSGTSGTRVVISAYGTGADPIFTSFSTVSGWTNVSGNIWESTSAVSTLSTCNIISINGANYSQGRTPNSGYWNINSTNGSSTIVNATYLNASVTNWTGAQVVMRKYRWIMDKYTITSASGSTINFTSSGDAVQASYGFFIINDQRTLDQANEWSYNSSTKKLSIYSVGSPSATIKVPTVETAIDLNGKNYITIENIKFQGFNSYGVYGTANDYINVTGNTFNIIGNSAIYLYVSGSSSEYCNFTGNIITDIGSMGIHAGYANNTNISNNAITRVGRYPGMGQNGDVSYCAIVNWGDDHVTSYNSVTAAGYCGIRFDGNSALIKGNFVDSTNFVKDDGGGIYVYPQQTGPSEDVSYTTRTVRDNIVLNTIGAIAGGEGSSDYAEAMGLYNDGTSPDIDYINNTVSGSYYGFFSNSGKRILLDSNTIYNCRRNIHVKMYNSYSLPDWTITHNISVAKDANQYALYLEPGAGVIPSTWTLNYNVYARPIDDNLTIWIDSLGNNKYKSLAQWKATSFASGEDAASTKSPIAVNSTAQLRIDYNNSPNELLVYLPAIYKDMLDNIYPGVMTLPPYSSKVLAEYGATPSETPLILNMKIIND